MVGAAESQRSVTMVSPQSEKAAWAGDFALPTTTTTKKAAPRQPEQRQYWSEVHLRLSTSVAG